MTASTFYPLYEAVPNPHPATASQTEAELLADDIAIVERANPAWLVNRAVIGARVALDAGVAERDVIAAFGADIVSKAKAEHTAKAELAA